MRLLFIYFYKDKGPFEKGTIIHLSKNYNFTLDEEESTEDKFFFSKYENTNFIDDFYNKNIDLGLIIGENGTGKSILINSIRDKKNDYSMCVYEELNSFYFLDNDLDKEKYIEYNVPYKSENNFLVKIDNTILERKRKFKSVYYSSILDLIDKNLDDDFNISNTKLLNDINRINLKEKIEQLEIDDLHKMDAFGYPIKIDISDTFFEDSKEFIKDSYILLFEKVMDLFRVNKDYNTIKTIFNKLPKLIINDIISYHLEENKIFVNEIKDNNDLVKEYLFIYKNNINEYLKENEINVDDELSKMRKKIDQIKDKVFDEIYIELTKTVFDSKNLEDTFEEIRIIFKIYYTPYRTTDSKHHIKIMLDYLYKEQLFKKCIQIFNTKKEKINNLGELFNKYKLYYLRQEFGYEIFILIDLYLKNKFDNISLINKKVLHLHSSNKGDKFIDDKEKALGGIKQIVEDNYHLFYEIAINNLETLDDRILILLALKRLEQYEKVDENKETSLDYNKAVYTYVIKLLKTIKLEAKEREELLKAFNGDENIDIVLIKNYHVYTNYKVDNDFEINDYRNFIMGSVHPFKFIFQPPISSGQKAKEVISARINHVLKEINKKNDNENILILLDEADLKLHLEWQRRFIFDLIEFLNTFENRFYILYATHSPMVLSDIPSDRVVFLEKEKDSGLTIDKQFLIENELEIKSTFGANIYDIYNDSFFMDSFMGEFAQRKINQIIDILNFYKTLDNYKKEKESITFSKYIDENKKERLLVSYNMFFNKSLKVENIQDNIDDICLNIKNQKEKLKKIILSIGEPMLKNKLLDDISMLYDEEKTVDEIVEYLVNKDSIFIRSELNKYSQSKQNEILLKLYSLKS